MIYVETLSVITRRVAHRRKIKKIKNKKILFNVPSQRGIMSILREDMAAISHMVGECIL